MKYVYKIYFTKYFPLLILVVTFHISVPSSSKNSKMKTAQTITTADLQRAQYEVKAQ